MRLPVFRKLRTEIIFSFCLLMVAGGVVTTSLVGRNLSRSLTASAKNHGFAFARTLAGQLGEPLAFADRLEARRTLLHAKAASKDVAYLFVVAPDGSVTDHSFPGEGFPVDLLKVRAAREPTALRTEDGTVQDLPVPILDGTLGTLHVGVSMGAVRETTMAAVKNVVVMTLLAMTAGVMGIFFLASLITRPVHRLREAAVRLGKGELAAAAAVTGENEIADLAITFNRMAGQIRDRVAESEGLRGYLERVLDHIRAGVTAISEDGRVEYANRTIRDEHPSAAGRACRDALAGERPCNRCPMVEALHGDRVLHRSFDSVSGRSYELTYVPFVGRDGRRSVIETAHDVTAVKQLATRLKRAERLAVAGELAAGVVHTINNPLDGVLRALDLAARHPGDPERTARMLEIATEGTERIAGVTRTLLNLARADGSLVPGPVSLPSIIEDVVRLAQWKFTGGSVTISVDMPPDLPPVLGDPRGLNEVLVNLVMNAVDATPAGGRIVIGAHRGVNGSVDLTVTDSGPGVAPELADRIFEPFFTTKEVGHGTGLGLPVARRIVEALGGEITAESPPGRGATFRVRLPIESEQAGDPAPGEV